MIFVYIQLALAIASNLESQPPKKLGCVRQITNLVSGHWMNREFQLEEPLYDAIPNPEEDGIEIKLGYRMLSTSTAAVSFRRDIPQERMVEYLDEEDTNEFLPSYTLSPDQRWLALFQPVQGRLDVFDYQDPANIDPEGKPHPWKSYRTYQIEDHLISEMHQILSPYGFAPRLQFSDHRDAGGVPRLLLSTPYRFLDFDLRAGRIGMMQQRVTPTLSSAFYMRDAVVVSEGGKYQVHGPSGLGRLRVLGDHDILGPLYSFQLVGADPLIVSPVFDEYRGVGRLAILRPTQEPYFPYTLQVVDQVHTRHENPITWVKSTRQGILTYSAEDQILRWNRLLP